MGFLIVSFYTCCTFFIWIFNDLAEFWYSEKWTALVPDNATGKADLEELERFLQANLSQTSGEQDDL